MRFLLKVNIPVESGNAAAKAGKLGATIQSILADLTPEAVYFTDNNGQRAGFIFLEMQDASQIPAIAEPWFLAFNASVRFIRSWYRPTSPRPAAPSRTQSKNTPDRDARAPLSFFLSCALLRDLGRRNNHPFSPGNRKLRRS